MGGGGFCRLTALMFIHALEGRGRSPPLSLLNVDASHAHIVIHGSVDILSPPPPAPPLSGCQSWPWLILLSSTFLPEIYRLQPGVLWSDERRVVGGRRPPGAAWFRTPVLTGFAVTID